jgi:DNA polymerase-3 subunit epsilon
MVEIGCVEMIGRVETGRHYHCYFNPDRPMPSEAEAVHGLSDIFLSDKPRFVDKVEELLEFIGDSPLVAHNASFDFGLIMSLSSAGRLRNRLPHPDGRHAGSRPLPALRRKA